jgi:phosphatidylinositol alpha-1,6-mannosyltransferase
LVRGFAKKEKPINKDRVLVISPDFPPPFVGGSLIYMHNLLLNMGVPADVLTTVVAESTETLHAPHRMIRRRFMTSSQNPTSFRLITMYACLFGWLLPKLLLRSYPVIVLNISAIGNGFFSLLIRLFRLPVVVIAYGEEMTLSFFSTSWKGGLKKAMIRYYRCASLIVCVCDFVKDLLIDRLHCIPDRLVVIPTPLFRAKQASRPSDLSVPRVLSVGRLIKRKGFDLLICAFNEVHQAMPSAELIIVGAGPERERLEALIQERNLGHCVYIKSGLSDAELAALYQTSRVFVLANVMLSNGDCEGCPNVLIEASASGLPVVGGIAGGASSAVTDGVTGFLLNPFDLAEFSSKILMLLEDFALAK